MATQTEEGRKLSMEDNQQLTDGIRSDDPFRFTHSLEVLNNVVDKGFSVSGETLTEASHHLNHPSPVIRFVVGDSLARSMLNGNPLPPGVIAAVRASVRGDSDEAALTAKYQVLANHAQKNDPGDSAGLFLEGMHSPHTGVRVASISGFSGMNKQTGLSPSAQDSLAFALRDVDLDVRRFASSVLEESAARSNLSLTAIYLLAEEGLKPDADQEVKRSSVSALGIIADKQRLPDNVIALVRPSLLNDDSTVAGGAAYILAWQNSRADTPLNETELRSLKARLSGGMRDLKGPSSAAALISSAIVAKQRLPDGLLDAVIDRLHPPSSTQQREEPFNVVVENARQAGLLTPTQQRKIVEMTTAPKIMEPAKAPKPERLTTDGLEPETRPQPRQSRRKV